MSPTRARRYTAWCSTCGTTAGTRARTPTQAAADLADRGWDIDAHALAHQISGVGACPDHSATAPLDELPDAEAGCCDCGESWQGTLAACVTWAEDHLCDAPTVLVRGMRAGWQVA